MKKAFFFDYDGTLVDNETKVIPSSAVKALQELRRQGHLLFVNTGRTKGILDPQIYDVPWDGMILGCGTYIVYHDEVLLDKEISKEQYDKVATLIDRYDGEAFFEGKEHLYLSEPITRKDLLRMIERYRRNQCSVLPASAKDKSFSKLFVCMEDPTKKEAFHQEVAELFTFIDRGGARCELVPKGYSKATGIQLICDHLHINQKDCYVFGDSNNDLPMFEYISNSILIGGENPELGDRVMYVSEDANHDGIEQALRYLKFLK